MKKTSIVISSAEIIGNNPDLLTQIVIRIPTKPLLKFRCVSKQWLSLLSCPDFCLSHTRYHHQTNGVLTPTGLLLVWSNESKCHLVSLKHNSTVPLFDFLNTPNISVIRSCNGLFLCKSLLETSYSTVIYKYFICNPTTRKFKELSFPAIPEQDVYLHLFLAFDPLKSPHYKIFRLWKASPSSRTKYQLDIYSSETDSWSASSYCFNLERSLNSKGSVFCNGKLYLRHDGGTKLLCLDVENESSMAPIQIALPINTLDLLKRIEIGECQGVLHVAVTNYYTRTDFELKVFEMKHDYSGWVLKHHLCIDRSVKGFYKLFQGHGRRWYYLRFYDVCITQVGKGEEPKIFVWIKNKVIFYDFEDGAWKFLCDLERKNHKYLFNYYENLSSV